MRVSAVNLVGKYIMAVCCVLKTPVSTWWEADFIVVVLGNVWKLLYEPPLSLSWDFHPDEGEKNFKSHSTEPSIQFSLHYPTIVLPSDSVLLVCIFTLIIFMKTVHRELAGPQLLLKGEKFTICLHHEHLQQTRWIEAERDKISHPNPQAGK